MQNPRDGENRGGSGTSQRKPIMNNESANGAEAGLVAAITECLQSGLLADPGLTWSAVERAIEPVAAAVFDMAAAGLAPETGEVLTRLGLTGQVRTWAAPIIEREIEAGEHKRRVFAPGGGLLVLD